MSANADVAGQHAEITDLHGALATLWKQIEEGGEKPLSRALTVNFIAVTTRAREAALLEAGQRLLLRHPCRAFVVVLEDDEDAELRAELGASLREERSFRQTVLEQIRLSTPARTFSQIPGLIRPLIVSDLPVYLFWGTALPERQWDLTTMARLADRTVVDSCLFDRAIDDLQRLEELQLGSVVDLASFRLQPWRRALAEAFEHFEWQPGQPKTEVDVTHGPEGGAAAAAYSLSRWLRERLGATVELRETSTEPAPPTQPLRLDLRHGGVHVGLDLNPTFSALRTQVTLDDRCLVPTESVTSRGQLGDLLAAAVDGS